MRQSLPFGDDQYTEIHTPEELKGLVYQLGLTCKGTLFNIDCYTPVELHIQKAFPWFTFFLPWMYRTKYDMYRRHQNIPKLINHLGSIKEYYCIAEELILPKW